MKISDLHLPVFPPLKLNRTASGRYVGESAEVKTATVMYTDGRPTDCSLTVAVASGAIIEVPLQDVEQVNGASADVPR